jgi:hypothetical protein
MKMFIFKAKSSAYRTSSGRRHICIMGEPSNTSIFMQQIRSRFKLISKMPEKEGQNRLFVELRYRIVLSIN